MAGLAMYLWERYLDKYGTEEEDTTQIIVERKLYPNTKVCSSHMKSLMAAADSYETQSAEIRGSQTMEALISNPVNSLKKRVKHELVRLNSFERREFSKEFGAELRRMGDLLDKDPNLKIGLYQPDDSDGVKLRKAADQFDTMFGKH